MVHEQDKRLEKLRADAAVCGLVSTLSSDARTREVYFRYAAHLTRLADELARETVFETAGTNVE